jgi:hypothetical protein
VDPVNDHDEDHIYAALDEHTWTEIGRGRSVAELNSGMIRPISPAGFDVSDPMFAGVTEPDPDPGFVGAFGEPGPWITAGFVSECAYGDTIDPGDTIRADGDGGWEHSDCVERDEAPIGGMTRAKTDYAGYEDGDLW